MKIDYKIAENIIKTIATQNIYKCVLLYGENNSAVNTKYKIILNNFKEQNYECIDLTQESLKENETLLLEEFVAISMFAEKTVYTLKLLEKENNFTKIIENLFEKNDLNNTKNFLIITAGGLDTNSTLRKYTEKSKSIACIACYEENEKNTNLFINKILKEYNFKFNYDVVEYLNNNIGNNNLLIENEIKKIDLYKDDDRKLTLDDIKMCVSDISNINFDDFCNNFCSLNRIETFRILDKILQENIEIIVILRLLIKYFLQLQKMRFMLDNGDNIENIMSTERVFWKQQIFVKTHLKNWTLNKINIMLEKLIDAEKNIKFSNNSEIELENFILKCFLYFK